MYLALFGVVLLIAVAVLGGFQHPGSGGSSGGSCGSSCGGCGGGGGGGGGG